MSGDSLQSSLEGTGEWLDFGEYEAAAYLAVLEHGELTATAIAERTDIPQPRVYDTVRGLRDDGLVEIRDSRPMTVLAVDPQVAFADYRTSLSSLVETLGERYTEPAREADAVSTVTARERLLGRFEAVLEGADHELLVSATPSLLDRFHGTLADQRDAGVAVDLTLSPAGSVPDPESFAYVDVATTVRSRRGVTAPILAVADGRDALCTTRAGIDGADDHYGIAFHRSELGAVLTRGVYGGLAATAETIADHDRDGPFPRRYATVRQCLADVGDRDRAFYATVEGRDVVTGRERTVTGRLSSFDAAGPAMTIRTAVGEVTVGGATAVGDVEARDIVVDDEPAGDRTG